MRTPLRRFAHLLERSGLALAGAGCGLFVGAHVGSIIPAFTTQSFLLIMMVAGAIGFYLGVDTPPLPFHDEALAEPKVVSAEFLSAFGTFLATLTAFFAVNIIVLSRELYIVWTYLIMAGWTLGIAMQIIAGTIARARA
ncbi:MAG: hypothetical protein ACREDL_01295 [Bradyrhizobium sp.]